MKALTKKRSNKHWTDMNQAVSLMDVAWLSIESVVSYEVLKLRLAMRAELGDRTSIINFTTLPIIIGMSSTCVCICPGCVTHISCQDASPGHMAMRASCCRCDVSLWFTLIHFVSVWFDSLRFSLIWFTLIHFDSQPVALELEYIHIY